MTELIARRAFPAAYIGLGLLFLVLFAGILPWKHRYLTVLVGFFAGILYFLVHDGIFHLVCDPRTISPGNSRFWVAGLNVSMRYVFTNLAWIWLRLSWLFGREAELLIGGIRSAGFTLEEKLRPLIVNSLLETNQGFPICSPFILPSPADSRSSCTVARRN